MVIPARTQPVLGAHFGVTASHFRPLLLHRTAPLVWSYRTRSSLDASASEAASSSSDRPSLLSPKERHALISLSRPDNIVPSFLIVLIGAWISTKSISHASVWAAGVAASMISVASCIVNDFFDYAIGTDTLNAPDRPLPAGEIPPDHVIGVGLGCYVLVLMITALFSDFRLRFVLALSSAMTLAYTPVFKRLGLLKNITVAGVVASAPLAGALAAGASSSSLWRVAGPMGLLFLGSVSREILMDIGDMEGDAAAGVKTFPVIFGKHVSMGIALIALMSTFAVVVMAIFKAANVGSIALLHERLGSPVLREGLRLTAVSAAALAAVTPVITVVRAWKESFERTRMDSAISQVRLLMGLGMVLLAFLAST